MKRIIQTLLFYSLGAVAAEIELAEYSPADIDAAKPVFEESFDRGLAGWELPTGYRLAPGEGRNGTDALFYSRTDAAEYQLLARPLSLRTDCLYRCSFYYRTRDIQPENATPRAVCVQYSRDGEYYNGEFPMAPQTSEWQEFSFTFKPREGLNGASVIFYLASKVTGGIWFDDICIEVAGAEKATVFPAVPKMLRLGPEGEMTFQAVLFQHPTPPPEDLALHVSAAGRTAAAKPVGGKYTVRLGRFPAGDVPVEVHLVNTRSKQILVSDRFTFFAGAHTPPANAGVTLDEYGRTLVNGKPFLPIGIFTLCLGEWDLERLRDAGFNTVMPYPTLMLEIPGHPRPTRRESVLEMLDLMQKYGIHAVLSLKDQNELHRNGNTYDSCDGVTGIDAVTEYVVSSFKDHPALLGWYLSDENPLSEIDQVRSLRTLASRIDPNHPTITLTFRIPDFPYYASSGDILAFDFYPITDRNSRSIAELPSIYRDVRSLNVPHWFVPQTFNWGAYNSNYNAYRYPTETEMRSMVLQAAIEGATGFLFFCYNDVFQSQEDKDPGSSKKFWPEVAAVASLLRDLELFLLSRESVTECTVTGDAEIHARAFRQGDQTCILVTSVGPGEKSAILEIPDCDNLVSKYGCTEKLGHGRYRFTGTDIDSDVLISP